jgi:hypothetical protein
LYPICLCPEIFEGAVFNTVFSAIPGAIVQLDETHGGGLMDSSQTLEYNCDHDENSSKNHRCASNLTNGFQLFRVFVRIDAFVLVLK